MDRRDKVNCGNCDNRKTHYPFDEIVHFEMKPYYFCKAKEREVRPDENCDLRNYIQGG